ncbi:hypothetical protein UA08_04046 [Talaromyces atroroseus]|uniref:Conserved oligomeric Golgi complex subunit 3 n=1 Tax=Talaromyces atroroseus TaxID=1441469 RepID=A0A1Q5Q904_TALAT|nr:hypothetical protein UA08_04046 [Talaromyces atroroseus]OKL60595.1 hypothetical protein UA08_04046 [Talaromyces atroroseus]
MPSQMAGRLRSPSDPSGTQRKRPKAPTQFSQIEESRLEEETDVTSINDELGFGQWYHDVEEDLLDASHEAYQSCLHELEISRAHLDSLLADTSSTLAALSSLSKSFQAVDLQTSTFQKQCEGLLTTQTKNTRLADDIRDNLAYYDFLDPASRKLNAPGAGKIVRDREFSEMLRKLDECLDYMESHPEQKEAETYRSRYRLLLTRALTLIRGHFVAALRETSSGVSKRIADKQLNDTTMSALLYAKFRIGAAEMKQIGLEIQKRAVPPVDPEQGTEAEYQSLMNELHTSFAATRSKLIIPLARKKLTSITQAPSTSKDLVAFARAGIGYIRGVCLDEFELWGEWFHGQAGLYDFLESICEPLYDHLRPRIIHETNLIKLCQLCTLLQTRYLSDLEEEAEFNDPNQLDFSVLIQPALADAQTRLVFQVQGILRNEIERYRPKPEDLDYPSRMRQMSLSMGAPLSGRKGSRNDAILPKTPTVVDEEVDPQATEKDALWDIDTQATFQSWYPTLRKAIWLLSRIYRLVNSTIFDDLAHQIVHQTTFSLHHASTQISNKYSTTDGQLFLIKHLLILKQQIVAFDIEYITPDISLDFSGITSTFWEIRERGGLFNPRNLMRLVGSGLLPKVVENMLDAKVELDGRLRTVINDFTNDFAHRMTSTLPTKFIENGTIGDGGAISPVCRSIEKEVPILRKALDDYLEDTRTKETLVGAVQDRVIQIYEEFYEGYASSLVKSKGIPVGAKGKGRQHAVWDVDTFEEWSEEVFRVGVAGLRSRDNDEDDEEDE